VEPLPGFEGMVGRSASMLGLFDRIRRVAPYDVPVLILGETGTGKERVAAALHRLSRRRTARFEALNCGALTRDLLRSELFGHERGAFTGALERRSGLLREVDGGTVFLDEVGELAVDAQSMLLRFLGESEVRAVGASHVGRVDVRVIAATHRDLRAPAGDGRFREDLYYRLRRVVLTVPPLRARLDDLPLLVEHLRRQVTDRHGLEIDRVTEDAIARLATYPWPGTCASLKPSSRRRCCCAAAARSARRTWRCRSRRSHLPC
jgi:DNA-binding NtrC family response regulator